MKEYYHGNLGELRDKYVEFVKLFKNTLLFLMGLLGLSIFGGKTFFHVTLFMAIFIGLTTFKVGRLILFNTPLGYKWGEDSLEIILLMKTIKLNNKHSFKLICSNNKTIMIEIESNNSKNKKTILILSFMNEEEVLKTKDILGKVLTLKKSEDIRDENNG